GPVARAVMADGPAALERYRLQPLQPVQPMLADSAADVVAALGELGVASVEFKIDGARIQVHKSGAAVRVYTRSLNEVTDAVPEVVAIVASLPADRLILDGEVIALQ